MPDRRTTMHERLREARIKAGYDTAAKASEAFGWTGSTYTHHENGTREFDAEAAIRYAKAFKTNPGWLLALDHVNSAPIFMPEANKVPYLGKVAAGVWLEQSFEEPDGPEYVEVDTFGEDASELFVVSPEGSSMNQVIPDGFMLVCRRVPFGLSNAVPGDLVIVERTNHDLRETTCKLLDVREGDYVLVSQSDRPEFKEPIRIGRPDENNYADAGVTIIGIVLRAIKDLRRRPN